MTDPTAQVPAEAVQAARKRWAEMWGDGQLDRAGEQMIDDVLAAAAPVIVAQALRAAIDYIARDAIGVSTGDPWLDEAMDQERINFGQVRRTLIERADELEQGANR